MRKVFVAELNFGIYNWINLKELDTFGLEINVVIRTVVPYCQVGEK